MNVLADIVRGGTIRASLTTTDTTDHRNVPHFLDKKERGPSIRLVIEEGFLPYLRYTDSYIARAGEFTIQIYQEGNGKHDSKWMFRLRGPGLTAGDTVSRQVTRRLLRHAEETVINLCAGRVE